MHRKPKRTTFSWKINIFTVTFDQLNAFWKALKLLISFKKKNLLTPILWKCVHIVSTNSSQERKLGQSQHTARGTDRKRKNKRERKRGNKVDRWETGYFCVKLESCREQVSSTVHQISTQRDCGKWVCQDFSPSKNKWWEFSNHILCFKSLFP